MTIFNIKLKTKAGNDIKKKETISIFFRLKYRVNIVTKKVTARYTYRIMSQHGIDDPKVALELKNSQNVISLEDFIIKVLLNFCHIIGQFTKKHNLDPDFVLFMSPEFDSKNSKAWMFLQDVFKRPKLEEKQNKKDFDITKILRSLNDNYTNSWTDSECVKMKIVKKELDMLREFSQANPNTVFMTIDPNRNKEKYAKSIKICSKLADRFDMQLQIAPNSSNY